MIDLVTGVQRTYTKDSVSGRIERRGSPGTQAHPSFPPQDSVRIQPDSLRQSIKSQLDKLKTELPGIIADAILDPVEDEVTRRAPITALVFRLENPLQSILGKVDHLSENLVRGLREEMQTFKEELPAMRDQALLFPFQEDPDQNAFLNRILGEISGRVDNVIDNLNSLQAGQVEPGLHSEA